MNETFGGNEDLWAPAHNGQACTWTELSSAGFEYPSGYWSIGIFYDTLLASYTAAAGTPATVHPGDPGDYLPVIQQSQD